MTSNLASIIKAKIRKFDSLVFLVLAKDSTRYRVNSRTNIIKSIKTGYFKKYPFFIPKKGVTGRTNNYLGKAT
jgi:hypothetical protein